jgi:polyisoprenoid-binding protein YceI
MTNTKKCSVTLAAFGISALCVVFPAKVIPSQTPEASVAAQEITVEIDAAKSKVHYMVESSLHTVHGTFTLKDGSKVRLDPATGKAGGEVAVYATSGESGNNSRDERMHREILETRKYPDFVFRPTQVEGKVNPEGASDIKLHGVMLIHGGEHAVVAQVHEELAGGQCKGTAKFDVPYIEWGIKDPSNWLLKVKPVVHVELEIAGAEMQSK